jgi:hypothetical protein
MSFVILPTRSSQNISRRDFFKVSGVSLFGLFSAGIFGFNPLNPEEQGRVVVDTVNLYSKPSFSSEILRKYWKDMVLPITEVTVGDEEPAFNRVWYRIGDAGYIHSGVIQPVRTQLNQPVPDIPSNGLLTEVTVPFTDAHRGASKDFPVAFRFYYETTYWIMGLEYNLLGEPWYRILEDQWNEDVYVPARHLRVVPTDELTPISPEIPPVGKRLEVRTAEQVVIAYELDRPVFMTRAATGARFSNGDFATPPGRFMTFHKRPSRHMAAGNLAYDGYDLPGVPWISFFTETGISFHGTYWHNNFGRPRSHGCVNLTPKAAKWIYRWTVPVVSPDKPDVYENYGTIVDVIS